MEIYIINICIDWLYKLYKDYIENIIFFMKNKFNTDIKNIIIYENDDYINIFKKYYNKENKFIFCGNVDLINILFEKYKSNNFYFLNIEQMSVKSYYNIVKRLNNYINIIDYSEENIPFLEKHFKKIFLLPPIYKNEKNLFYCKEIDIISFSNNSYRKNFLDNINKKYNIKYIDNIFGEERDELFKKTKIYINIHSSEEHNTMELIRIVNLLKKKVIVLSQNSIFFNLIHINKSILLFNDIEQLEFLLEDILINYESYYENIFQNTNLIYYDNYICQNIKKLLND